MRSNSFVVNPSTATDDSNMIPLINIVFLMLIFFMVAGRIAHKDAAHYEAPYTTGVTALPNEEHVIVVAADGSLWMDGVDWGAIERLSEEDWQRLGQHLEDISTLIVKADAHLPAQRLDPLLKQLRVSAIANLQLAVQQSI